jgi:lysophospholipase L1-like esterase
MNFRAIATTALVGAFVGASMPASTANQERSLVILGASYAQGWGTPPLPGYIQVVNRGVGGEETGEMLKRFQTDVVASRPDAVLIWGLVNNITRSPPDRIEAAKAAARGDYIEMIRQARTAGIEVILATEVPWTEPSGFLNDIHAWIGHLRGKQSYGERVSAHVREVNAFLRDFAKREGIVLLDFERVFAPEGGTRKPEYGAEDGSHISAAGYAALTAYSAVELRRARKQS